MRTSIERRAGGLWSPLFMARHSLRQRRHVVEGLTDGAVLQKYLVEIPVRD